MTFQNEDRKTESSRARVQRAGLGVSSAALVLALAAACGNEAAISQDSTGGLVTGAGATTGLGGTGATGTGGSAADANGGTADSSSAGGGRGGMATIDPIQGQGMMMTCPPTTCAEQGYACGSIVDTCGTVINCADEGLTCGPLEACIGGLDMPTTCQVGGAEPCELCGGVPDCSTAAQQTILTGRVVTPGRDDADSADQLGVPNAFVYILRNKSTDDLPAISSGIPAGGTSCDRCGAQDLGPVLVGTVTDATGAFKLEGDVPVGEEFTMVVKAGHFRRAVKYTLPDSAACQTTPLPTALPDNPARLPRSMQDGLAVNIPRIAVTTGSIDAMECVLAKMGIASSEFDNPGADGSAAARVHMYQGSSNADRTTGDGLKIDASTPLETVLYSDLSRLQSYDMVLADCEGVYADSTAGMGRGGPGFGGRAGVGTGGRGGTGAGGRGATAGAGGMGPGAGGMGGMGTGPAGPNAMYAERDAYGANVREYVNRGGRMFASHLRYTWLLGNGTTPFDAANPISTGLDAAATWNTVAKSDITAGQGVVSVGRPQASPRIQNFADWMSNEKVAPAPNYNFDIIQPRSQEQTLGMSSEEFAYTSSVTRGTATPETGDQTQQFSFNTPYGATDDAVCGRVAYSGFHVSIGSSDDNTGTLFKDSCSGALTAQEKVLLYMLFDLAACVGEPPPPPVCKPQTCDDLMVKCGFTSDGCGKVVDCGPCPLPPPPR